MSVFVLLGFLSGFGAGLVALPARGLLVVAGVLLGLHLAERVVLGAGPLSGVVSMLTTFFLLQIGYGVGLCVSTLSRAREEEQRRARIARVLRRAVRRRAARA